MEAVKWYQIEVERAAEALESDLQHGLADEFQGKQNGLSMVWTSWRKNRVTNLGDVFRSIQRIFGDPPVHRGDYLRFSGRMAWLRGYYGDCYPKRIYRSVSRI